MVRRNENFLTFAIVLSDSICYVLVVGQENKQDSETMKTEISSHIGSFPRDPMMDPYNRDIECQKLLARLLVVARVFQYYIETGDEIPGRNSPVYSEIINLLGENR